jgi:hypothetical protein
MPNGVSGGGSLQQFRRALAFGHILLRRHEAYFPKHTHDEFVLSANLRGAERIWLTARRSRPAQVTLPPTIQEPCRMVPLSPPPDGSEYVVEWLITPVWRGGHIAYCRHGADDYQVEARPAGHPDGEGRLPSHEAGPTIFGPGAEQGRRAAIAASV